MNYSKLFIAAALSAWCGTGMQSGTSRTPMPMITAESNASATDITLTDQGDYQTESYENKHVRVEGKTNLFLTGNQPLSSSTIRSERRRSMVVLHTNQTLKGQNRLAPICNY